MFIPTTSHSQLMLKVDGLAPPFIICSAKNFKQRHQSIM